MQRALSRIVDRCLTHSKSAAFSMAKSQFPIITVSLFNNSCASMHTGTTRLPFDSPMLHHLLPLQERVRFWFSPVGGGVIEITIVGDRVYYERTCPLLLAWLRKTLLPGAPQQFAEGGSAGNGFSIFHTRAVKDL